MKKIIIFGNSGSGKSTLAKEFVNKFGLAHLDLDVLAWQNTHPPTRKPLQQSAQKINAFLAENNQWVIEGGYADLLKLILNISNEVYFLNPGIEACIKNCKNRPWEPHKYSSMKEQDENLEMLIGWVEEYYIRHDDFSLFSHRNLFDDFSAMKTEYLSNRDLCTMSLTNKNV